jgi:hypothetical protein
VRGDEVLHHGEAFAEVRRDRGFDDVARRLGHQAAHGGELTNLGLRTTGLGRVHQVDAGEALLVLFHLLEHDFGHFFGGAWSIRR